MYVNKDNGSIQADKNDSLYQELKRSDHLPFFYLGKHNIDKRLLTS